MTAQQLNEERERQENKARLNQAARLLNAALRKDIRTFWFVEDSGTRHLHSVGAWLSNVFITESELSRLRKGLYEAGL